MAAHAEPDRRSSSGSRRFDALAEALPVAVLTAGADGAVDYANPAARELFWRSDPDLLGSAWLDVVDVEDRDGVRAAVDSLDRAGVVAEVEFRLDVGGILRCVRGRLSAVDADPGPEETARGATADGWVGLFDDVTSQRAESVDLAFRADHDALTGLPNRTLLHDRVEQAMARSIRAHESMAILFLDLDRFKPVNDRLGHSVGDEVLREVAARLRREVRASDTVARLGGDEFVVVAEGIDREISARVAHRLIDAIEAPLDVGGERCDVSASVGVAWGIPSAVSAAELIHCADHAMYEAKRTDRAVHFAPDVTGADTGGDLEDPSS